MTDAIVSEVINEGKRRGLPGWSIAAVFVFVLHAVQVEQASTATNRRIDELRAEMLERARADSLDHEAVRLLLCNIVDTTRERVATACQGIQRRSFGGLLRPRQDSMSVEEQIVLDAVTAFTPESRRRVAGQ